MNPVADDCEKVLIYEWSDSGEYLVAMHAKNGRQEGIETIKILGLNRLELLEERGFFLRHVLKPIAVSIIVAKEQGLREKKDASIADLKKMIAPDSEFSGLARAYFRAFHLAEYF